MRRLTYINKNIDYDINRQKAHTPLKMIKEKEMEIIFLVILGILLLVFENGRTQKGPPDDT